MRKIAAVLLLLSVTVFSVFPAVVPSAGNSYAGLLEPYRPITARALGMGTTGIAATGRSDSFFINPASLGARRFQLSLPSLQVTMYHLYDMVSSDIFGSVVNGSTSGYTDLLTALKSGRGKLADIDAGLSFTAGGFGFGVNTGLSLLTHGGQIGGLESSIIGEVNAVISLGYGYRFHLPDDFSIDLGAMVRFNYLAYTEALGANEFIDLVGKNSDIQDELMNQTPIMVGYSFPIDVGMNLNMPYGFSFGLVARNLNGRYYMTVDEGLNGWGNDPFGTNGQSEKFNFDTDWSLDAGVAWTLSTWYLSPTIAIDFTDIVGICQTDNVDIRDFMYHLNIGAEIRVLSFLDIRAGLSQGYWSLGVGLDLWAFKVDVAYFRHEFGNTAGEYGLDGLTIRFNIGYDR